MKNILLVIFCLSIIANSFSQNADAEYLQIRKEYTLNENGSIDFHYSKELKLLTHFSFHRLYGETFIVYNTDFQNIKVNSSYTIMADGKKVITPDNAFNEVLPRFSTNAPAFNNIRELVVTHTGLEKNAIINLDYTLHSDKGYYPYLMGNEVLSETSPVNELIIIVNIPDSQILNYELLNFKGEPIIDNKNGEKIYTWKFNSIAANSKDYYQESNHEYSPRLIFSTAKNLQSAYDQFINQDAFVFNTNTSMDNAVDKITSDNTNQLTIALELQKFVSSALSTLNIPLKYTGFHARTAIETWNSNMGTHIEKTLLLATLLRKANITADPVAIIPTEYYNKEIGNMASFNSFLVRIKLKEYGELYISAIHVDKQNLKYGIDGNTIVLLDKNIETLKTSTTKPATNKILVSGDFIFHNSDSMSGEINLELTNKLIPYFKLYDDSSYIKSIITGGVSGTDFISSNIKKLSQESIKALLSFEKGEPTSKTSNYMSFEIPYITNGIRSWHITQLPSERLVPLEIPNNIYERYEYAIVFPKELKLVSNLKNIEIKNDAGYLLIKFEKMKDEIIITREIKFDKKVFGVDEYDDFREIMNTWNNKNYLKVILKK
jgi:hypothetical protein